MQKSTIPLNIDVFQELASEWRCSMLFRLDEKNMKLTQLSKELDMTIQESHRQFDRLSKTGLVKKNSEGFVSLTPYGKTIVKLIPSFQFLEKNKKYFAEHTLGDLPDKFIQRIANLNNCEFIEGVVAVLEKWRKMILETKKQLRVISPQVALEASKVATERATRGMKIDLILQKDAIAPKGSIDEFKQFDIESLVSKGILRRKMIDDVQIAVVLNEKQASILFSDLKGEADMDYMFFSDDPQFYEWCLDYFNYQWNLAGEYSERKIRER